jgi:hypothetical protein
MYFKDYGGRGITVCDRWRDSFENFLTDMGEVPPKHEIDRIDPNGNYEPGNCQWVPRGTGIRRVTIPVTIDGKTMTLGRAAVLLGVDYHRLHKFHYLQKRPIEEAVALARNGSID